ncbi:MAG: hypothetical protein E7190_08025 [Erysipelotrichaceae bacterium]|nr:hypothetical protein [Erysipelotrichaceae bacterium]
MKVRNTKDIAEKNLLSYPEVFCDAVNNLVLKGKGTLRPQDLIDMDTRSSYEDTEGDFREYYRDVVKGWKNGNMIIAAFGIENMSDDDNRLFLKFPGYVSSMLKNQVIDDHMPKSVYSVFTIGLYYGFDRWHTPKDFRSWKKVQPLPEAMQSLQTNYIYNVIDLGGLSEEEVSLLDSDLFTVADFCRQMRQTGEFHPEPKKLKHPKEVFALLKEMTGTTEFEGLEAYIEEGELDMKRYPMGPVEKAKKEMQKQMEEERAKMETERAKMETERTQMETKLAKMEKKQAKFETLIHRITEKFGEEGISLLKESGLMDSELSSVPNFSTGTGSGS